MANVTPGSSSKLNIVRGISTVMNFSAEEETSFALQVFPANVLIRKSNNKIYLADGITALQDLQPVVDQVLTLAEKQALDAAFDKGAYARAANGVVVHNAVGKIDDASLNLVDETTGYLVDKYLGKYIDDSGVIKVEALPATARAGTIYVYSYADLANLTDEQKKSLAFVINATDDPSGNVKKGSALYAYQADQWVKIAEAESLDIDVDAIKCNYENAQAAGAVMYDHPIMLKAPTATELISLMDATNANQNAGSGTEGGDSGSTGTPSENTGTETSGGSTSDSDSSETSDTGSTKTPTEGTDTSSSDATPQT